MAGVWDEVEEDFQREMCCCVKAVWVFIQLVNGQGCN